MGPVVRLDALAGAPDQVDAAADKNGIAVLIFKAILKCADTARRVAAGGAQFQDFCVRLHNVARAEGRWPACIFPGNAANEIDVAADRMVQLPPKSSGENAAGDDFAKLGIFSGLGVCMKPLRVIRSGKSQHLFLRHLAHIRGRFFPNHQIFKLTHLCHSILLSTAFYLAGEQP